MKSLHKNFLLKESYTSYVFWGIFVIALVFYFALYKINNNLSDINYLVAQKNQLETETNQNALEITALQNFVKAHANTPTSELSPITFTRKLEKLLQQYAFANDCLAFQQNGDETVYTVEDTTDYFLLLSFLLDLCMLHANFINISMKAEGEFVHFVIMILG